MGLGYESLYHVSTGYDNVGIGVWAGRRNQTGAYNIAIGYSSCGGAAGTINSRSNNTAIGVYSLAALTTGANNVGVGYASGYGLTTGGTNVFIGNSAGYRQTTNSNLLIIDNQTRADAATESTNAIVYGTMAAATANQTFKINAYVVAKEAIKILERSSDPAQPAEGECVIWLSDGTGYGDDGDICAASTAGGNTKKAIIFDFSAGDAW